jgi:hypothetical protein
MLNLFVKLVFYNRLFQLRYYNFATNCTLPFFLNPIDNELFSFDPTIIKLFNISKQAKLLSLFLSELNNIFKDNLYLNILKLHIVISYSAQIFNFSTNVILLGLNYFQNLLSQISLMLLFLLKCSN